MPGFWLLSLAGQVGKLPQNPCLLLLMIGHCSFFTFWGSTSEHSRTIEFIALCVYCIPTMHLVQCLLLLLLLQSLEKQQAALPVGPLGCVPHGNHWESPVHSLHPFFKRTRCGYISDLLLSFLMWSHSVGFWLALCVLVSISSLSWIQCLVSVYCILCISYSLLLLLLLLCYSDTHCIL